jgi:hypothetical protein
MTREPGVKRDGMLLATGGVSSAITPELLERNELAFAVNCAMRGGFPSTRPRVSKKTLLFPNEEIKAWFEDHPVQGYTRTAYRTPYGKALIGVSIGGRIFTISPEDNFAVLEITPASGPNIPTEPIAWFEQAEKYLIIQNDKDGAIIFDGASSRRANGVNEVPTGSAMVYNEEIGRLCVAVHGNEVAIGDVVGGPTDVISFTETGYLNEGGRFRVPMKYGKIVGMSMIANLDRSNGQGPMLVFAQEGISTFNLPPNRETWKTLTYPVQVNMPIRYSATSQASIVLVNGDVYYRGKDGLRSFVYAIREFQGAGNVPISTEMRRITDRDSEELLNHASTILFDNRILFTVNPGRSNGIYHRGIGSLDLDLISRLKGKLPPAYDGVWTGLRPTGMMTGQFAGIERAFIFSLNPDSNTNELWELHKESGYDTQDDEESRIGCAIETRAMIFDSPVTLNKLQNLEVWVDNVIGTVTIGAQFRPDSYPCWISWPCSDKTFCAKDRDCSDDLSCKPLETYNPGYYPHVNFGQPPDSCNALAQMPVRTGYTFQFRLHWIGQCRIRKIVAKVNEIIEEAYSPV